MGANEVEGGGASDLVEGLAEKLFLTVDIGLLQELEELAFFGATGTNFGKGIHGIAANLFRRVLEEREEPLADRLLEGGLIGLGKTGTDSTDDGNANGFFLRRGLIEAGNFFLPEFGPREQAELPVEVFGGIGSFFGHGRESV